MKHKQGKGDALVVFTLDIGCGEQKRGDIGVDLKRTSVVDVVADAHNFPFRSEIFDKSYAFALLEHVDNPIIVLQEIKRVLKGRGELEILVPTDSRLRSDYVVLILSLHLKHLLHEYKAMKSGEHKWQYSEKSLRKMLTSVGFLVDKIYRPALPLITGRRVGKIFCKLKLFRFPHLIANARNLTTKS